MTTQTILYLVQIISAVLLIGAILLQNRGTAIGGAFGGSSNVFSTRRGLEKKLHYGTIVLGLIFFLTTIATFLLPKLT